jgi:uroporphyrinogen-III synthase
MRVVVTRPAAQAASWVQSLAARGIDAVALPLIGIAAAEDPRAVAQAWRELPGRRLAVFVSPNAAEQFFAQREHDAGWPDDTVAGSVGPGTTQALRRLGVPAAAIVEPAADAPQFDSEALWRALGQQDWSGASVLIVRGDGGRDWLAETLRAHGARVDFVAAYRRVAPHFEGEALRTLDDTLARPHEHLWFFSSSEAIDHLVQARPGASWAESRALATHPRIALRARDCGFQVVHETRPSLDAVVACIQSLAS